MKTIVVSAQTSYKPVYTLRGDRPCDDPQSVMEWLADTRKMIADITKELADACANDEPVGITVTLDGRTAYIVGESKL
jgi:hypothetical protein